MLKKIIKIIILFFIINISFGENNSQKLTIMLDWAINPDHAPLLLAVANNSFKQAGLTVELTTPIESAESLKLVAARKVDLVVSYQPQLVLSQQAGLPIKQIGTLINQPLDCLVALKDNNINTLKDLKNKKVGYYAGFSQTTLSTLLKSAGLKLSDVDLIATNDNLIQPLLSHKIVAFSGAMRNVEPLIIQSLGYKTVVFYPEEYGMPRYSELVFVANKNITSKNLAIYQLFFKILKQAVFNLKQHPDLSWQLIIKKYPDLDSKINYKIFLATITKFSNDPELVDANQLSNLKQFLS